MDGCDSSDSNTSCTEMSVTIIANTSQGANRYATENSPEIEPDKMSWENIVVLICMDEFLLISFISFRPNFSWTRNLISDILITVGILLVVYGLAYGLNELQMWINHTKWKKKL